MTDLAAIPLTRIDGQADSLANHAGKVLLVVNVASKCGLTPQYEGLEALYRARSADGLEVLGFPANDFGAQEPGTHEEIAEFCSLNYGVSFPLFAKADVTGPAKQPLYAALTEAVPSRQGPSEEFREMLRGYGISLELREVRYRTRWQCCRPVRPRRHGRRSGAGRCDRGRTRQIGTPCLPRAFCAIGAMRGQRGLYT